MLRLTIERQARGWNKTQLARKAGIQAGELGKIEAGRVQPYPSQLRKLGRALGIPAAQDESLIAESALTSEETARATRNTSGLKAPAARAETETATK